MKNVKLNEEQIEELKKLYADGYRYLLKKENDFSFAYKDLTITDSLIIIDNGLFIHRVKLDFLKNFEPFYFGDLFEVVYKGEV